VAALSRPDTASAPGIQALSTLVRIFQRWRLLLLVPLGTAIGAGLVSLLLPTKYVASASFVPEESPSGGLPSSLAGLAAQFGIAVPAGGSRSADFYASLLRARSITDGILTSRFPNPRRGSQDSLSLVEYLRIRGATAAERLEKGRRVMQRVLRVSVDRRTNVVGLTVELGDPNMAAAVANRYLRALNDFNLQVRESVGRARRIFVERRLEQARGRLLTAEDSLRRFHERNVRYADSPELVFEQARLQRAVNMAQELYTSMAREYELARIAEVNDTPVITVLDSAQAPVRRSWPRRRILVLAAGALAALLAVSFALIQVKADDLAQRDPASVRRLRGDIAALWADIRRGLRIGKRSNAASAPRG